MVLKIVNKNRQFTTYSCNLSVIFVHKCCPNMEIEAEEQKNLLPQNASQYPKTFHEKFFSTRYRIAFLGFLGFASIFTMRVTMSIAIVEMVTDQGTRDGSYNENCPASENVKLANTAAGTFDWTTNQQAHILAAPFYGYLASQLPGTLAAIGNTVGSVPGFGMPIAIDRITDDNIHSKDLWLYCFYLMGVISAVGGVMLAVFGSGELQPWANPVRLDKQDQIESPEQE
ncbi:putative inorganic phosphate cotransporter isoform X2 [Convolutriloba macropyga]|uniref:putative inorganic phosphate cotransporter isoform X2 n=1 Tax=Convolutriloba macropyga TaxID=536237 RepID=UPI003F521972